MAILDSTAQTGVDGLQAQAQRGALLRHYLPRLPRPLARRPLGAWGHMGFYKDKLLPLEPAQGELLYLLARARNLRRAAEFGTSFGVSATYARRACRCAAARW